MSSKLTKDNVLEKLLIDSEFSQDTYTPEYLSGHGIVIVGAGSAFHWALEILIIRNSITPKLIIDKKFKTPCYVNGIKSVSFEYYKNFEQIDTDNLIIITLNDEKDQNDARKSFELLGFHKIILLFDIYAIHNPFDYKKYSLCEKIEKIHLAHAYLADDISRNIYRDIVKLHATKTPLKIPFNSEVEQYFPRDVPLKKDSYRIISCGSGIYDIKNILGNCGNRLEELLCIEPDTNIFFGKNGYYGIYPYVTENKLDKNIRLLNKAVSNYSGLGSFMSASYNLGRRDSATSFGSKLEVNGKELIEVISLDSLKGNFSPTLICTDAEGEDLNILKGARSIINSHKPDIAVSTYHVVSHLWDCILCIKEISPQYNCYIRNYTGYAMETMVYATTNNT